MKQFACGLAKNIHFKLYKGRRFFASLAWTWCNSFLTLAFVVFLSYISTISDHRHPIFSYLPRTTRVFLSSTASRPLPLFSSLLPYTFFFLLLSSVSPTVLILSVLPKCYPTSLLLRQSTIWTPRCFTVSYPSHPFFPVTKSVCWALYSLSSISVTD